jgi:hypothetical protein
MTTQLNSHHKGVAEGSMPYTDIKQQMKTGDLLLWRSNSLLGAAIRFFSKGTVNHASIVMCFPEYEGEECRRWTTEALEHGTVLNLLSRRLDDYDGQVWWYPLKDDWEQQRSIIGHRALEMIGIPYDYKSLFKNIVGKVSAEARRLFCSEYYYLSLGLQGEAPTPADLPNLGIFKQEVKIK